MLLNIFEVANQRDIVRVDRMTGQYIDRSQISISVARSVMSSWGPSHLPLTSHSVHYLFIAPSASLMMTKLASWLGIMVISVL